MSCAGVGKIESWFGLSGASICAQADDAVRIDQEVPDELGRMVRRDRMIGFGHLEVVAVIEHGVGLHRLQRLRPSRRSG